MNIKDTWMNIKDVWMLCDPLYPAAMDDAESKFIERLKPEPFI